MYANNTMVPIERSRGEIERLFIRSGASGVAYMAQGKMAMVAFQRNELGYKIFLPLPDPAAFEKTPAGRRRRHAELDSGSA